MTKTLLTWNILADCTKHHFKNPNDILLSRETRTPLIIKLLLRENSDIICLQEVDSISFKDLVNVLSDNYVSELSLNQDKRFGCATFIKKDLFTNIKFSSLDFNDGSKRICQIISIDDFTIANCHLDFKQNFKQIKQIINNDIICGDFNATINSGTLRIAKENGYNIINTKDTVNTNGNPKTIDFILVKNKNLKESKTIGYINRLSELQGGSDHLPVVATFNLM